MQELSSLTRNTCRSPGAGPDAPDFEIITQTNPAQQRALDLIQAISL